VTYTYTDANQAVSQAASPNFYLLTASNLVNLSVDWDTVMSAPIDLSFFMTNATNEARLNYPSGGALATYAIEGGRVNQPRMFGFRMKYHFGD
jgi:iron complex outermembrane receptor protein